MRDPIPVWTAWARKMVTFESISSAEFRRPLTQQEYVNRMTRIQRRAAQSDDMLVKTTSLWTMENLSASFQRNARPGQSLKDARLPVEVKPIAHCGIGIGAVELSRFQIRKLISLIDSFSDQSYRMFAFENVGAMLRVYEPGVFNATARFFAMLGILPVAQLQRPEPRSYLGAFEPEAQRLISHGYGRMLYFTSNDILGAVRAAVRLACFPLGPCVNGIAFAYSMVNNRDLRRVFMAGQHLQQHEIGRFFTEGLTFALEFWEWFSPGLLDRIKPWSSYGNFLIETARNGVAAGRARGALAPFAVEGD